MQHSGCTGEPCSAEHATALVDGAAQDRIWLQIGSQHYDLLA